LTESKRSKRGRVGCAVVALAVAGLLVGGGLWLARVDEGSKASCERYADTLARALANCHRDKSRSQLLDICEQSVDATPACLDRIKELSCADLELAPGSAGEVCQKGR
jgi:hypothetical protein